MNVLITFLPITKVVSCVKRGWGKDHAGTGYGSYTPGIINALSAFHCNPPIRVPKVLCADLIFVTYIMSMELSI